MCKSEQNSGCEDECHLFPDSADCRKNIMKQDTTYYSNKENPVGGIKMQKTA